MEKLKVKGLIFDYGGTIDSASVHWSEVLWKGYEHFQVPVTKEQFREAYVHGERTLAKHPLIKPEHNFLDLLRIKLDVETLYLVENEMWQPSVIDMNEVVGIDGTAIVIGESQQESVRKAFSDAIAHFCYNEVLEVLKVSRPVLKSLFDRFPMVLVSNFYGNINTILDDFDLPFFQEVVESAVVGVRKPDPRIFQLGVEALGLAPQEVAVVGDSYSKDILPAKAVGCQTVWFKGIGWNDEQPDGVAADVIIDDFKQLEDLFV